MKHPSAHQQLFVTQCGGLSASWARAAQEEARQDADRAARPPESRQRRRLLPGRLAGLVCVACVAGILMLGAAVLPVDPKVAQLPRALAGDAVRSGA